MNRKNIKKTLSSIFLFIFVLITLNVGTFAHAIESNNSKGGFMDGLMGKVLKNTENSYTLSENYAKFDGTVYEYDLSQYFAESTEKAYLYEIADGNPENGEVLLDGETGILTVTPHKRMNEKIVVSVSDGGENPITAEFRLKFIDAQNYVTEKIIMLSVIILIILFIFGFISHKLLRFKGRVRIDSLPRTTSKTKHVKRGTVKIPSEYKMKGYIYSVNGDYIQFVAHKSFYYVEDNTVKEALSVKIPVGEELNIYSDKTMKKGIVIEFMD